MLYYTLWTVEVLIAIILICIILLQPHEGEGMGAVFGGSSGVDTFLGTKTITVLWKTTIILGVFFIGIAIALNLMSVPAGEESGIEPPKQQTNQETEQETTPSDSGNTNNGGNSEDQ